MPTRGPFDTIDPSDAQTPTADAQAIDYAQGGLARSLFRGEIDSAATVISPSEGAGVVHRIATLAFTEPVTTWIVPTPVVRRVARDFATDAFRITIAIGDHETSFLLTQTQLEDACYPPQQRLPPTQRQITPNEEYTARYRWSDGVGRHPWHSIPAVGAAARRVVVPPPLVIGDGILLRAESHPDNDGMEPEDL